MSNENKSVNQELRNQESLRDKRTKRISVVVTPIQYNALQELQLAYRLTEKEQKSINSLVCEAVDEYINSKKDLINKVHEAGF